MHLKHIRRNAGDMGHMPSDASLEIGLSFPIHGTFGFQLTIANHKRSSNMGYPHVGGSLLKNADVTCLSVR